MKLEKETLLQQFDQIETRIERLIEERKRLQDENQSLTAKINHLESLVDEQRDNEDRNEEIKAVIKSKIDSLIGRLDGFTEETSYS